MSGNRRVEFNENWMYYLQKTFSFAYCMNWILTFISDVTIITSMETSMLHHSLANHNTVVQTSWHECPSLLWLFLKPGIQKLGMECWKCREYENIHRILGNLLEDSGECHHFNIGMLFWGMLYKTPGNDQDNSREYLRKLQGMFERIRGYVAKDSEIPCSRRLQRI